MRILGNLMHHVGLVRRMAQVTGTDLVAAHDSEEMNDEAWAEIVQNCRRCDWSGRCQDWLDSTESTDQAPGTCRNRARFEALKAAQSDTDEVT